MNLRDLIPALRHANAPAPAAERVVTLGWLCLAATVAAALLAAAYTAY
jgi:hypothetical protein